MTKLQEQQDGQTFIGLFQQVMRLHFLRWHAQLEKIGLYPGQPPLLLALHGSGQLSSKELADRLMIKPATVTVMVQRMERAGLVQKKRDTKDLRKSIICLTERGEQTYQELQDVFAQLETECMANLSEEEQQTLIRLFFIVRQNLFNHVDEKMACTHLCHPHLTEKGGTSIHD